jgi:cell wall-associated NlpC family hydrolase
MVFRIAGFTLPRDTRQQSLQGKKIKTWSEVLPGDLAFFSEKGGAPTHVGIIMEDEKIIHASGMVRMDKIMEDGILNPETKIFTHLLHSVRRIL